MNTFQLQGIRLKTLPFGDKICESKFLQIFSAFIVACGETTIIPSQLIVGFAKFGVLRFNVSMVGREEPFLKSPKL